MAFDSSYLVDCSYEYERSELCYESFYGYGNYGCAFISQSRGCTDVWFSFDMSGCESCFLSWNLRNKKYCFMNEQLSKEAYQKRVAEYKDMTYSQQRELVDTWKDIIATKAIHQASQTVNCTDCSGNLLKNCNNVHNAYIISNTENSANLFQGLNMKECMDCCNVAPAEFCYEMTGVIGNSHCRFVNYSYDNSFVDYSDHVFNSEHLFGCVGINKKKYCILNVQYTEEEYKKLREKIITHMKSTGEFGEFFPFSYSPFDYNETYAQDLFPLTQSDAEALGATWNESMDRPPANVDGIQAADLPDRISEVEDSILQQAIICEVSGRPYKIKDEELEVYRRMSIPLPRRHPEVRFQERLQQRPAPQLHSSECDKCARSLQCTYAPDSPETIYCDDCYKAAVLA